MKFRLISAAAVATLAIGGCNPGMPSPVGKWTGTVEGLPGNAQPKANSVSLELKEDQTFAMTVGIATEGTYTVEGETVTLKLGKVMGMTVADLKAKLGQLGAQNPAMKSNLSELDRPTILKMSEEGKKLTSVPQPGEQPGTLVLTRAAN